MSFHPWRCRPLQASQRRPQSRHTTSLPLTGTLEALTSPWHTPLSSPCLAQTAGALRAHWLQQMCLPEGKCPLYSSSRTGNSRQLLMLTRQASELLHSRHSSAWLQSRGQVPGRADPPGPSRLQLLLQSLPQLLAGLAPLAPTDMRASKLASLPVPCVVASGKRHRLPQKLDSCEAYTTDVPKDLASTGCVQDTSPVKESDQALLQEAMLAGLLLAKQSSSIPACFYMLLQPMNGRLTNSVSVPAVTLLKFFGELHASRNELIAVNECCV